MTAPSPAAMLSVHELRKSFKGTEVVKGVSLDVAPGEIVGLLGTNGAGKTTTFRMIMGMFRPDRGAVTFLDQDVTRWPMYRRCQAGMGYLAQEHSVFKDLSAEKNLLVVLERMALGRKDRQRECDRLLDEYGLSQRRKVKAGSLSGGQKRRLEIARALITKPRLMLFDEPFAGVDPIAVGDIQAIVYGLRDRGIAVFITDHKEVQILSTSDRVYLMHEGEVVVSGSPQEIVDSDVARRVYLGRDFKLDLSEQPQPTSETVSAVVGAPPGDAAAEAGGAAE
jgi:lipopolysaccharide export system ATP-binding protein